jgi:hypothetical protein
MAAVNGRHRNPFSWAPFVLAFLAVAAALAVVLYGTFR